jgi:hypothetical protein
VAPSYIKFVPTDLTPSITAPDTSVYEKGGFFDRTEFVTDGETLVGTSDKSSTGAFVFSPVEELRFD